MYKFKEEITIDESTGLPQLPDGLAWKVGEHSYGYKNVTYLFMVEWKEYNYNWFDRLIQKIFNSEPQGYWDEYTRLRSSLPSDLSEENILKESRDLYRSVKKDTDRENAKKRLSGVYPPKKLESDA